MASTTGTARSATHASIRAGYEWVLFVGWIWVGEIAASVRGLDGVGLNTQRKMMGVPSVMPPAIPPEINV